MLCPVSLSIDGLCFPQVPIVIVLKAMGVESDQEIVQMVGRDPKFAGLLSPSMQVHRTFLYIVEFPII